MAHERIAAIVTEEATNTWTFKKNSRLFSDTENESGTLNASVGASVSAFSNLDVGGGKAFECSEREYDFGGYNDDVAAPLIQPDRTTKWPLDDDR